MEAEHESTTKPRDPSNNSSNALLVSNEHKQDGWIVDSNAIYHMTLCSKYFVTCTEPRTTSIFKANGVMYLVIGAEIMELSPSIYLSNSLFVPFLSNKLLFIKQATEELNCVTLIYPHFYIFQDILTKEIIRRGIKRDVLYYMDCFSTGRVKSCERLI